jgi:hypothetical protein
MIRRGDAALATVVLLAALMLPTAAADAVSCDVVMFGARGDGTTDDTQAINAALATASPCDTVIFSGGTYRVTGALAIGGDRIVQGSGKGRTVIASASETSNVFSMTGSPATGRLTIRDLTVGAAAGTTKTAGAGILVSGGTTLDYWGTMVDNVEILDMPTGVDISGGQFSVTNSQIWYSRVGIYVHNDRSPDAGMNNISNNRIYVGTRTTQGCATGNKAVYVTGSNDTKITSNWLAGGDYGIYVTPLSFPVSDLKVTANSIEGQCAWALYADAGSSEVLYTTVTGNEVSSAGTGFKFTGGTRSSGLTLTGNFIVFNGYGSSTSYTGVYIGPSYVNVSTSSNVLSAPGATSLGYDVRTNRGVLINGHIIDVATMFAPTNVTLVQGGGYNHSGLPANVAGGSYGTCFDCKNVKDAGFSPGDCVPWGTGNLAFRSAGGSWICN